MATGLEWANFAVDTFGQVYSTVSGQSVPPYATPTYTGSGQMTTQPSVTKSTDSNFLFFVAVAALFLLRR